MSGFSEYLESYMKEHQMNAAELAVELDVDRTTVFRWMKGKREPKSVELVMRIAQELHMPTAAREKLFEEHDKLMFGEEAVNAHKYVRQLLHDLKYAVLEASDEMRNVFWRREAKVAEGMLRLKSRKEISMCASALFVYLAGQEEESSLELLVQPSYEEIQEALLTAFGEGDSHVKIEQILCLEQRVQKSFGNLDSFRRILPLCFADIPYEVRYYYDFLPNHINEMSWMPNVILAGSCVIQFDFAMSSGIFVNDAVYAGAIRQQYEIIKKQSTPLALKCTDLQTTVPIYDEMLEDVGDQKKAENAMITVFHEPCIAACVSTDIYEEYLVPIPAKKQFIALMEAAHGDWKGMTYQIPSTGILTKTCSFFQIEGIRNFMRTGIISEFPIGFYRPFTLKKRLLVLERMIKAAREGIVEYRLLPDDIELPEKICFYWGTEEKRLYLNYVKTLDMSQIRIVEPGICGVFRKCLEYMEEKGMLYSIEDTIQMLEELKREYQR